jgi:BlaI family penicillinase repressor
MKLKELTKAEEQIMQILWQLNEGIVKDIIEKTARTKTGLQYRINSS